MQKCDLIQFYFHKTRQHKYNKPFVLLSFYLIEKRLINKREREIRNFFCLESTIE